MNSTAQKQTAFAELVSQATECQLCPALIERRAVLSEKNGSVDARVMFIGEAPGRQGGDRTGIPFSADSSGRNFERFLATTKLTRASVFITNAVLCNPRKPSGANRTPTVREAVNCSKFLQDQITLIDPQVLVTLGRTALEALRRIHYHEFTLHNSAGRVCEWGGRLLVPLYHPSPQVLASHRREAAQLEDYCAVTRAVRRMNGRKLHLTDTKPKG